MSKCQSMHRAIIRVRDHSRRSCCVETRMALIRVERWLLALSEQACAACWKRSGGDQG